jgi:acetoacetyl-CoA synthetase
MIMPDIAPAKQSEFSQSDSAPLWSPSQEQKEATLLHSFINKINTIYGHNLADYKDMWHWSIDHSEEFWSETWDFCDIIGEKGERTIKPATKMQNTQFFPDAALNYAENLLRYSGEKTAIIFRDETGAERSFTSAQLYDRVSVWQQALIKSGIQKGDRIAGCMPNTPETIIATLAATSLGAIWSSAYPDFGEQGLLDRFSQIEPKVLVSIDGYYYSGKTIDCLPKIKAVQTQISSIEHTIIVPFAGSSMNVDELENTLTEDSFIGEFAPKDIAFTRVAFNHPLFIMFSSGTTGAPKCIIHGHGGTLMQHMKEHQLQSDIRPGDTVFYFTTCGWMMWNWLASALASRATLMLYDGSPFYPDGNALWRYAQDHKCTFFGTSAKYIDALKSGGLTPGKDHDLSTIRTIASTGSPLVHESFDYVYEHIKSDVHLASISGGTDIVSCFMLGNAISPVYRGELQSAGLGLAVNVYGEDGAPLPEGAGSGELVCTAPFPCMPVGFWNDEDGTRYNAAYFERFDNIWTHGDWVERTANNGYIIHGRSDATLNPGGVRIGTSEIYRQVEQIDSVIESICVGQDWDGDVRVVLFVILKDGAILDDDLTKTIKTAIRTGASPRHVPAKIITVTDIPRTKSGKITELAVRDVIMNRPIKNVEALANPEALELYKDLEDLRK